ncbi:hypothetical protein NL676_007109 [Syzygium grande]|nr:hypothetical protein NL676_007109 [Syzygium grande]
MPILSWRRLRSSPLPPPHGHRLRLVAVAYLVVIGSAQAWAPLIAVGPPRHLRHVAVGSAAADMFNKSRLFRVEEAVGSRGLSHHECHSMAIGAASERGEDSEDKGGGEGEDEATQTMINPDKFRSQTCSFRGGVVVIAISGHRPFGCFDASPPLPLTDFVAGRERGVFGRRCRGPRRWLARWRLSFPHPGQPKRCRCATSAGLGRRTPLASAFSIASGASREEGRESDLPVRSRVGHVGLTG